MSVIPETNLISTVVTPVPAGSAGRERASLATAAASTLIMSFSYLEGRELSRLSRGSIAIRKVAETPALWVAKCKEVGIEVDSKDIPNAKKIFKLEIMKRKIVGELAEIAKNALPNGRGGEEFRNQPKLENLLVEFIQAGGDSKTLVTLKAVIRGRPITEEITIKKFIYNLWSQNALLQYIESSGKISQAVSEVESNFEHLISERGLEWIREGVINGPNSGTDRRLHQIFDCAIASSSLPFSLNKLLSRAIKYGAPLTADVAIKRGADIRKLNSYRQSPMSEAFVLANAPTKEVDFFRATPCLQIMSLLRDAAIDQFARELLPLSPGCLPPFLVSIVASYHETDLFNYEFIAGIINSTATLWSLLERGRTHKFDNRAIIMALKEGPKSLMNLRDSEGTLLAKAVRAGNTELVVFLRAFWGRANVG